MTLNDRARELADRLAADADAARLEVTTLANGVRLIDCREAASRRDAPSPRSAWEGSARWHTRRSSSTAAGSPDSP